MSLPFDPDEAKARIDGRPVVLSVSGGKDSTATGLVLKEAGIPFRCVHMDTGWEHEETDAYVRDVLPEVLGPVEILSGKHDGMEALCLHKGMFPSRLRRFCTQELKVFPFRDYVKGLQSEGHDPVNVVGIRAAESRARASLPELEENKTYDCEVWRPLIRWSEQDVIDCHARHGVKPNPLYLNGAERVGCWPCIFMRKAELALLADLDPERVERIAELEAKVEAKARARYEAKGETFERQGYKAPCFFRARARVVDPETGKKVWGRHDWPIAKVIEWATAGKDSPQMELFASTPADTGCMRWGLCDAVPA